MIDKKELKKIMTDLAKGKITQKDVELLINPKKRTPNAIKSSVKGKYPTQTRKIKLKEVK